MTYRPELDGLRALAFLAVFSAHLFRGVSLVPLELLGPLDGAWWFRGLALGGAFGVDLFFVLSGYLITTLLLHEERRFGRFHLGAFWARRALRILPAYYALIAGAIVLNQMPLRTALSYLTFTTNLPIFTSSPSAPGPINVGVLWSIQIEEQFYLVWPLLLLVVPRRARWLLALSPILVSLAARAWLVSHGASLHVWGWRLDALGVGAAMALIPLGAAPAMVRRIGALAPVVAIVGAGLTSQALVVGDPGLHLRSGWLPVAIWMPSLVALVCGAAIWASAGVAWLTWRPLVRLGRISYGLYLIHCTVISWFDDLWWLAYVVLSFVGSVLVAELSYRLIESPFLRLKRRFTHDRADGHADSPRPARSEGSLAVNQATA